MQSLKNHFSFIIPLFVLLFSVQFIFTLDRAIKIYESKLTSDYSIIVVSEVPIEKKVLKKVIPEIKSLKEIKKDSYLNKLKSDISDSELVFLRATLPKFYSLKLNMLPSQEQLHSISKKLRKLPKIKKVETFKKTFNKFHQFLKLTKNASTVFNYIVIIISTMLIIKQMDIWRLQHQRRMYIMGLFGAPFWMQSASLYKAVILDSIIAAILVGIFYKLLPSFTDFESISNGVGLDLNNFMFFMDTLKLILISLAISIISVSIVMIRQKNQ